MSDPALRPPPVRLLSLRAGDLDVRSHNLDSDLRRLDATIDDVVSVTARRVDDEEPVEGDLEISPEGSPAPFLGPDLRTILWWCGSSVELPERDYLVTVVIETSDGQILSRDLLQLVVPRMG